MAKDDEIQEENLEQEEQVVENEEQEQNLEDEHQELDQEEEEQQEEQIEEDEQQQLSPRQQKRKEQLENLLDKIGGKPQQQTQQRQQQPQQRQQVIPEGEYDLDEINQMAAQYGQQMYQQGFSQMDLRANAITFENRLTLDAQNVNREYSFLDRRSEDFQPGVAGFVNQLYLSSAGYDPNTGAARNLDLRYDEFVEGFMQVVELISNGKVVENTKNVASQAAKTGMRPGGAKRTTYQGDDPSKMTDSQLDEAIRDGLKFFR